MSYCNKCGRPHQGGGNCGRKVEGGVGTNYLTVQQNPNAPIYVAKGYSDENVNFNIVNRTKPNISFVIGMKRLTFKLNDDGKIDVEYDPEDFTAGALRVVEEVKRMLGVEK